MTQRGNLSAYDKMECFSDAYPDVINWYTRQMGVNEMVSPGMDGTNTQLVKLDLEDMLEKAAITSADTGALNALYSLGVFMQHVTEANVIGALKHESWRAQGYRAVSAASKTSGLGVTEGGSLGTAVEPTYIEVEPTPKEIELVTDYSTRMLVYAQIADAITVEENRKVAEADFWRSLSADILQDCDTLASNNFESIDRITGSYSEITGVGQDAGDLDVYSQDRDTEATWVDANSLHNSGTDRTLTIALIDELRQNQERYWKDPKDKFYITGYTSWTRWSQLESAKQRYGTDTYNMTVGDGVQTAEGGKGSFKLATWDGWPIIRDSSTQTDTIDRIYLLDGQNIGIAWGLPVTYSESDNAFAVGHLVRGLQYGIGELYATHFKAHGKLRDLS